MAAALAVAFTASPAPAGLGFGEGNGVPPGYTPKDFSVFQRDGVFHALYIMSNPVLRGGNSTQQHLNEQRFGHAVSTDLMKWTFVDSLFGVEPTQFDRDHVWAPTLLWADGRYWMFYTGVSDTLVGETWKPRMHIGLAWTFDFSWWGRSAAPVFECGAPDSPWADCDEGGLRDPFVVRADTSATGTGWFMYFVTQPTTAPPGYYDPLAFLVGTASGHEGDMTFWSDFGPNWSTYRQYQNPPSERTNKVESPHVFRHNGTWYLFFTGDNGLVYLTGANPVGDIPVHQGEWTYQGGLDDVWSTEFASEAFRATWEDGTVEDYFGTVRSIGGNRNEVLFRIFNPASSVPLLADPLLLNELRPVRAAITEGETLEVAFTAELGSAPGTIFQVLTRPAPLEVWEVDDANGVRTMTRLTPSTVGLPSVPQVTTHYGVGDYGDTLKFTPNWILDDDATPNRLELMLRCRGAESGVIAIGRAGTGAVTGVDDAALAPLSLRAIADAGGAGATFRLELPLAARARLEIFDVRGRHLRTLLDRDLGAGPAMAHWDGRDDRGARVASGVTFARLTAGGRSASARVLTLR